MNNSVLPLASDLINPTCSFNLELLVTDVFDLDIEETA